MLRFPSSKIPKLFSNFNFRFMNIYVGNINFKMDEDSLRQVFEEYGEVGTVKIITDKMTGKSKGFGFVEMEDDREANEALKQVNGAEVMGKALVVNEARPKTQSYGNSGYNSNNSRPRFQRRDTY